MEQRAKDHANKQLYEAHGQLAVARSDIAESIKQQKATEMGLQDALSRAAQVIREKSQLQDEHKVRDL